MQPPAPPPGFVLPDDAAPLDLKAHISQTPEDAQVRGMFFRSVVEECRRRGIESPAERDYTAFRLYSMRSWQAFAAEAVRRLYPDQPVRVGLRRLGLLGYPTFASSMVGRVIFGVLGKDLGRIMRIATKGFEHSLSSGGGELVAAEAQSVHLRLHGIYGFFDSYVPGVFEGAMQVCERKGEVYLRPTAFGAGEVFCRWW